jgi:type VI secretion system secreted protein Hcp
MFVAGGSSWRGVGQANRTGRTGSTGRSWINRHFDAIRGEREAMPIYMKYEGLDGSVTETGHAKWIELESCQVGVNRNIVGTRTGSAGNRDASVPSLSDIHITKLQDNSSNKLFQNSLWGEGKLVKIDFCRTDKDKQVTYMQYELENTLISNFQVSGAGGEGSARAMESLALNFTKLTVVNTETDIAHKGKGPDRFSFDLATHKGS